MVIEHEVDQRPLQPRPHSSVGGPSTACDLSAALEVEELQPLVQLYMIFESKGEGRLLADRGDAFILFRVGRRLHFRVGKVG